MLKVLVSNIGFGEASGEALLKLQKNAHVILNVDKIRFDEELFIKKIADAQILIAGTEKITKKVIDSGKQLKLIARVGVGVDNIDLDAVKSKKVSICYTPDAPTLSVPEFTLSLILNLIKGINISNSNMHQKNWHKPLGNMLSGIIVGVVGCGKIGSALINLIKAISPFTKIIFYDPFIQDNSNAKKVELEEIFKKSDVITLHLPLNEKTTNLIDKNLIKLMKKSAYIINTSRGGIINEDDLYNALKTNSINGAAIDTFEKEPYTGPLCELENCLLTPHIGSSTKEVREVMEEQIVEDIINFINGKQLLRSLPTFNFLSSNNQ